MADGLIDKRARTTYSSEHVLVVSGWPRDRAAEILSKDFEAVFSVLQAILPQASVGDKLDSKVHAYLFVTEEQYHRFARFVGDKSNRSSGMYFPGYGVLAFYLAMGSQPGVRAVMFHEITHAYRDRRVSIANRRIPSWLDEGLAEYVGLSDVVDGRIHLGSYVKKQKTVWARKAPSFASENLRHARFAEGRREKGLLDYLLTTEAGSIADEDQMLEFYGAAWLFVDYLRHGRPASSKQPFASLVQEIAAGHGAQEALEATYGMKLPDLERGFRAYIKAFKLPRMIDQDPTSPMTPQASGEEPER